MALPLRQRLAALAVPKCVVPVALICLQGDRRQLLRDIVAGDAARFDSADSDWPDQTDGVFPLSRPVQDPDSAVQNLGTFELLAASS